MSCHLFIPGDTAHHAGGCAGAYCTPQTPDSALHDAPLDISHNTRVAAQSEPRVVSLAATTGSISRPSTPLRSGSKSHGQSQSYEISPYKCGPEQFMALCWHLCQLSSYVRVEVLCLSMVCTSSIRSARQRMYLSQRVWSGSAVT